MACEMKVEVERGTRGVSANVYLVCAGIKIVLQGVTAMMCSEMDADFLDLRIYREDYSLGTFSIPIAAANELIVGLAKLGVETFETSGGCPF